MMIEASRITESASVGFELWLVNVKANDDFDLGPLVSNGNLITRV